VQTLAHKKKGHRLLRGEGNPRGEVIQYSSIRMAIRITGNERNLFELAPPNPLVLEKLLQLLTPELSNTSVTFSAVDVKFYSYVTDVEQFTS
jgi:hypothetical protein